MVMNVRFILLLSLLLASLGLSACETVKGAGRDIQRTGEAMDDVF